MMASLGVAAQRRGSGPALRALRWGAGIAGLAVLVACGGLRAPDLPPRRSRPGGLRGPSHTARGSGRAGTRRATRADGIRRALLRHRAQRPNSPSPLAFAFYNFNSSGKERRHWIRADTGYGTGKIWRRRALGSNSRNPARPRSTSTSSATSPRTAAPAETVSSTRFGSGTLASRGVARRAGRSSGSGDAGQLPEAAGHGLGGQHDQMGSGPRGAHVQVLVEVLPVPLPDLGQDHHLALQSLE